MKKILLGLGLVLAGQANATWLPDPQVTTRLQAPDNSTIATRTELEFLSGATANVQAQFIGLQAATASIQSQVTTNSTAISSLNGATSALRTDLTSVSNQVAGNSVAISSLQGVTGGFVQKAGDTMTGSLLVGATTNASSPSAAALVSSGGLGVVADIIAGGRLILGGVTVPQFGFAVGGQSRYNGDSGSLLWSAGLPGSAGATDYSLFSVAANTSIINVSTAGDITHSLGTAPWVKKSGDSMTGGLNLTAVTATGNISASANLFAGAAGAGSGGKVRLRGDSGDELWRVGLGGAVADTSYEFRSIPAGATVLTISTAGNITQNVGTAPWVKKTGDSMTGDLTLGSSGNSLSLDSVTVAANAIAYKTAGSNRWIWGMDGVAESGSNAGSGFQLRARNDAGGGIDNPITITRAAGGAITLSRPLAGVGGTMTGNVLANSGTSSSSPTTGALRVQGGTGITGALYVGADIVSGVPSSLDGYLAVYNQSNSGYVTLTSPGGEGRMSVVGGGVATIYTNGTEGIKVDAAQNLTVNGLTASRLVRTNGSKTLTSSSATPSDAELDYLIGLTASIQTQVNARVAKAGDTMTGSLNILGGANSLQLLNSAGNTNWQISSNNISSNVLSLTPSTAPGGVTFTTPVFNVSTAGITTSGTITATGGTMSGSLMLTSASTPTLTLQGVTGDGQNIDFRKILGGSGLLRWRLSQNGVNETGSNAGSNIALNRYTDAGAFLGTSLAFERSTGNATFEAKITATGGTMSGAVFLPNGSAAAPSVAVGANDQGWYSSGGAGSVGLSVGNSTKITVNSAVNVSADFGTSRGIAVTRTSVASSAAFASLNCATGFVNLTGTTATTIQGIALPTLATSGSAKECVIWNATGQNLTIAHQNGTATAAERIITPTGADMVTTGNGAAILIYNDFEPRWVLINLEL